jgi:hypothetical protein
MKTTPINTAEAVFEAFFDETLSGLPHWKIHAGGAEGLVIVQKWAWVQYDWQRPPANPSQPALRLSRAFTVDCADYDALVFSLVAPPGTRVALIAGTDAGERRNFSTPGQAQKCELLLPLTGARRLLSLTIELYADSARTPGGACGWFNWIGLQHGATLERYLRQFARFDERWEDYLKPDSFEPGFEPAYGLHLTGAELAEARAGRRPAFLAALGTGRGRAKACAGKNDDRIRQFLE